MISKAGIFSKGESGATAVEFALVSPLIFASVLGTFEIGRSLYAQNHLSAACAAGARAVTLNGADDTAAIEAAIRAKFDDSQQSDLTVVLTNETISGMTFKKIEATYEHDFLVKFGHQLSGFTLTASRYAPAA